MTRSTYIFATTATAVAALLINIGPSHADTAQELALLRQQMAVMMERLAELEAKQAQINAEQAKANQWKMTVETRQTELETQQQQAATAAIPDLANLPVVRGGETPGSFVLPGTNTEIKIGGYVKADFIYDLNQDVGDFFVPELIDTDPAASDEEAFSFHARQSRLNVATRTPSDLGEISTLIEADFVGDAAFGEAFSNSFDFRLRHAVLDVGPFKLGQFWSVFTPLEAYPSTVDFQGPAGIPFQRQAQARYTLNPTDKLTLAVAVENPETTATLSTDTGPFGSITTSTPVGGLGTISFDETPDFTAAATYQTPRGPVKLATVLRTLSTSGSDSNAFGYGVNLSTALDLTDSTKLQAQGTYGDGVGRYIINGFGLGAFQQADGDLDAIEAYGLSAFINQRLSPTWNAQIGYGRYEVLDNLPIPASLKDVQTVHASLFFRPVQKLTFGAELIYGERTDQSGADDEAFRLQTSAQVNF